MNTYLTFHKRFIMPTFCAFEPAALYIHAVAGYPGASSASTLALGVAVKDSRAAESSIINPVAVTNDVNRQTLLVQSSPHLPCPSHGP